MKFTVKGRLSGLNEYTNANRSNRFGGASLKKKNEKEVALGIAQARADGLLNEITEYPIRLRITWYEPNNRRDCDNIQFATKFIQDSMVHEKLLPDDSRKYICGLEHIVKTDKDNPRIEVEVIENVSS